MRYGRQVRARLLQGTTQWHGAIEGASMVEATMKTGSNWGGRQQGVHISSAD